MRTWARQHTVVTANIDITRWLRELANECTAPRWKGRPSDSAWNWNTFSRCLRPGVPTLVHRGRKTRRYWYLESNSRYLVNYGWRYRRGMPISSSIAESAVNEVVSLRCAKKRQMRWTD